MPPGRKHAVAYLRTSSAANAGGDSDRRQRQAIRRFAIRERYVLSGEYYDAAISGADPIEDRPGFRQMLSDIAAGGPRVILVETANRFARDLLVQEVGHRLLSDLGIELVAVDSPSSFLDDTPTAVLIRQVLGAVAQFEKSVLVAKLRAARERKRAETGKGQGRKSIVEIHPDALVMARRLRRRSGKTGKRRSYRAIARMLAEAGYTSEAGKPFSASSVMRLLQDKKRGRRSPSG